MKFFDISESAADDHGVCARAAKQAILMHPATMTFGQIDVHLRHLPSRVQVFIDWISEVFEREGRCCPNAMPAAVSIS